MAEEPERPFDGHERRSSESDADGRFRRLYVDHERDVRNYCRRRLRTGDVDDAVADVFVVAWRKIESLPIPAEVRPWLFGVARNVVRNLERGGGAGNGSGARRPRRPTEQATRAGPRWLR